MNDLKALLDKIELINYKYQISEKENEFNIFSIIGNISDEVNLHSKFIAELLRKDGSHGVETKFLEQFLQMIEIDDMSVADVQVRREYKNIDILLTASNNAVIIENKIWATDQDKQIFRYVETMKSEGYKTIHLFYLTPYGTEPSEQSAGKYFKEVKLISYKNDIRSWIQKCISISAEMPELRETLSQYRKTIDQLTGKTMSENHKKEILNLLRSDNNILKAQAIAENWVHVKWHTEWDFWCDLENELKGKFEILQHQKYSVENLNSCIHRSRNRNPWYGLMLSLTMFENYRICILIERGYEGVYFGLTAFDDNTSDRITHHDEYLQLTEKIKPFCERGKQPKWFGLRFVHPLINFEKFSDEHTLRLFEHEYRKSAVKDIVSQIEEFRENVLNAISEL